MLAIARAFGQERRLRKLRVAIESKAERRNRRDHEQFKLVCAAVLDARSSCVDVGAFSGELLADIVRAAPGGRHIAYEPLPEFAAALAERFPRVEVRQAAVGAASAEAQFLRVPERPAWSGLRSSWHKRVERLDVRVDSLDGALPDGFAPRLLKVAAQGSELEVLEGARATIAEARPYIMLEHGEPSLSANIFGLLDANGYAIYDMDGGGPYDRVSFERDVSARARWHFLAVPHDCATRTA